MVSIIKTEDGAILRFGGGLNTRASADEINEREASNGQNFVLDLQDHTLRNRAPFDLVGTAPNGASIDGLAQLKKVDGTITTLVQAGTTVYRWAGQSAGTFTAVGSVNSGAKIRGPLTANWLLNDLVIITDLAKVQPVMTWNGASLSTMSHNLGGSFFAKYCLVSRDRALYANVKSGADTPHLLVGSEVEDYTNLSVSNRPSSSLGVADPWFLTTTDLRPINGIVDALGTTVISSEDGKILQLSGADSKDFAMSELYPGSGASGSEPMAFIGNDVAYGRQGAIETLRGVNSFGDVEADDVTVKIADQISSFKDWTLAYNRRTRRLACFAGNESTLWVMHKPLMNTGVSPWMRWITSHSMGFQPTTVMALLDPDDGLEYTFMGDSSGNLYRLEGTGSGDGGSADVEVSYTSPTFKAPLDAEAYELEGWISYVKDTAATVTLEVLWAGTSVFNTQQQSIALAAATGWYYNDSEHYSGSAYHGAPFSGRIARQRWFPEGQSNEFQIRITASQDIAINEVGIRLKAAST